MRIIGGSFGTRGNIQIGSHGVRINASRRAASRALNATCYAQHGASRRWSKLAGWRSDGAHGASM